MDEGELVLSDEMLPKKNLKQLSKGWMWWRASVCPRKYGEYETPDHNIKCMSLLSHSNKVPCSDKKSDIKGVKKSLYYSTEQQVDCEFKRKGFVAHLQGDQKQILSRHPH